MPILEFEIEKDFLDWVKKFASPQRYDIFVTNTEIIAQPIKTSRPLIYGYYQNPDAEMSKILEKLRSQGFTIIRIRSFSWDGVSNIPKGMKKIDLRHIDVLYVIRPQVERWSDEELRECSLKSAKEELKRRQTG